MQHFKQHVHASHRHLLLQIDRRHHSCCSIIVRQGWPFSFLKGVIKVQAKAKVSDRISPFCCCRCGCHYIWLLWFPKVSFTILFLLQCAVHTHLLEAPNLPPNSISFHRPLRHFRETGSSYRNLLLRWGFFCNRLCLLCSTIPALPRSGSCVARSKPMII